VDVNVATYALATFHIERVYTVQQTPNSAPTRSTASRRCLTRYYLATTQIGLTRRARRWTHYTSPAHTRETRTTGAKPLGPYYTTVLQNCFRAARYLKRSPPIGKEHRGIKHLPSWRATRESFHRALTYSDQEGGTDAGHSTSLIDPSLSSGFPFGMVVPLPGISERHLGHGQHATNYTNNVEFPVPCG
jgi:hypothetical protein